MPNLPADSLYKFLTIGGSVGIGAFASDPFMDSMCERTLEGYESYLEYMTEGAELWQKQRELI